MATTELATKISFVGSLRPLEKLNHGLETAVKTIGITTIAFTTAGYAVNAFVSNSLAAADAQGQLVRETGVSMEAIQEWGYVASVNGSSAEAFENSLRNLSVKIGEASIKGSEDFNRLGISVRDSMGNVKNAERVMVELRGKMQGLSKEQKVSFLEKLGIDKSMLQTMNLASNEIDNLRQEARALGVVIAEEADQIIKYNDSMTTLKYGVDALQKKLAISLTPQLTEASEEFTDLLINNKALIKDGFSKMFEVIGIGFKVIYRFGGLIKDLFSDMTDGQKVLLKTIASIYALNKAFSISPLGKVIALISGVLLVIEDLNIGLQGGKSVVADWFKSFDIDALGRAKLIIGELKVGIEQMAWALNNLLLGSAKVSNVFGASFDVEALRKDIEENNRVIETQRAKNMAMYKEIQRRESDYSRPNLNQNSLVPRPISNTSNSNMNQTNNMTFNVKSTDPKQSSQEIERMLKNANNQFGVGGK